MNKGKNEYFNEWMHMLNDEWKAKCIKERWNVLMNECTFIWWMNERLNK